MNQLSTGNILDVSESVRGDYLPYEGMSSPAVTRDCPNRGRDLSANSSAAILDVADRATGNAPVTDGLQVGDEGGEVEELPASPLYLLASEIVDIVTKGYEQ